MISTDLSKRILSVGPEFKPPKGGIAQVMYNYSHYVFPKTEFRYISNSCDGLILKKIGKLVFSVIRYLVTLIFHPSIKIVHIHTASNFSFKRSSWFVGLAKLFRKKTILHVHGGGFKDYFRLNAEFVKQTLGRCDLIVVLTDEWGNWFREEVGVHNLVVVPNVIPEPSPCVNARKTKIFNLLFLGLINDAKGVFDLVDAIKSNRGKLMGHFQLHIGGNGEVQRLKEDLKANHLEDLIVYEGWVDSNNKHDLLCNCDALILPSYVEGLPLSILEAMSYSKPVITTPVGGIPSMIKDGVNGFLVEPGDGLMFIDRIIYLMEHSSECMLMGHSSFSMINKHLPQSVAAVLEKIYKSLIGL